MEKVWMSISLSNQVCDNPRTDEMSVHTYFMIHTVRVMSRYDGINMMKVLS